MAELRHKRQPHGPTARIPDRLNEMVRTLRGSLVFPFNPS